MGAAAPVQMELPMRHLQCVCEVVAQRMARARRPAAAISRPVQLELLLVIVTSEAEAWAEQQPVHRVVAAAGLAMPETRAARSIFDLAAILPAGDALPIDDAPVRVSARPQVTRAGGTTRCTGSQYPANRWTPEREEQERIRRAKQKPPKPVKAARTKGAKLREMIGGGVMGRPSKLTEKQWAEIERRLIAEEPARALAREFGVSEAAIRKRFGTQVPKIKAVAEQIVATERALSALPVGAQISAQNLASKLRAISDNLASAAHYGAATAHRLQAIANAEVAKVDDADPLASVETLKGIGALTRLANDSAATALNLIAANKATVEKINADPPPRQSIDAGKLSDQALQELLAARG